MAQAAVITADSQEQWKYGMFDPESAARGPGTSQLPTTILTYRSVTDITTTAYGGPGATTNFQVDSTGGALIIVTPIVATAASADNAAAPYSGLWCSTNDNLLALNATGFGVSGQTLADAASSATRANWNDPVNGQAYSPVKVTFFQTFQGAFPVSFEADAVAVQQYMPWRVAGLRATLTQTTSALNAQGSCAAGDFGDFFYTSRSVIEPDLNTVSQTAEDVVVSTLDVTTPEWAINQGNNLNRFRQVGSLAEPGVVYEAIALPVNELFWQYHTSAGEINAAGIYGSEPFQTLYSNLQFLPAVGFLLRGIAPGNTFRLNVTLALEVQIDLISPLGFLYNQARFTDGYFPNLRDLRMSPSGGHLGELLALRADGCAGCAILLTQRMSAGGFNPSSGGASSSGGVTRGRSGNQYVVAPSGSPPPVPTAGAISPTVPAAAAAAQSGGVFSTVVKDVGKGAVWVGEHAPELYRAGQFVGKIASNLWGFVSKAAPVVEEVGEGALVALGQRKGRRASVASYGSSFSRKYGGDTRRGPYNLYSQTPDAYGRLMERRLY